MEKLDFRTWLMKEKGMGKKSAADVISRCSRIERTFNISLSQVVISDSSLKDLIRRIENEYDKYLKPETNPVFGMPVVRRAAKLYAEYLNLCKMSL